MINDTIYPEWANRSANKIITINRKKYLKCVKCGGIKLLSEYYSYFYYTKTQKKKKYKNSCKECHKKVVTDRIKSNDKFRKLHTLYNKNYLIRKSKKDSKEDKSEYLGYLWQRFGGTPGDIHEKRKDNMENLQKKRKRKSLLSKRKRKDKLIKLEGKRAEQKLIVDILT